MITGEWKPMEELVAALAGHQKVVLAGCATCVAECATGGEREVATLKPLLRMACQAAGSPVEIETMTLERQCNPEFVTAVAEQLEGADVVLSIACGIGVQVMGEIHDPLPVLPGINTTSLTARVEPGLWAARCEACGDCMLGETFGLCPVARCAKSLMNGPCGGTRNAGFCEVDETAPCIWHRIWERARERGDIERLLTVRVEKDWSNSSHGVPKRMIREDLRP